MKLGRATLMKKNKKNDKISRRLLMLLPLAALILGMRNFPGDSRAAEAAVLQHMVSESVATVELSQLAQNRSQNEAIRHLAASTISSEIGIIRTALHAAKLASLPTPNLNPSDAGVAEYAQTISYHGHAFDQQYLNLHQGERSQDLAYIDQSALTVHTPAIVRFISIAKQQLSSHETLAIQTERAVRSSEI
jgi:predicted outer membrane protein